MKASLAGVRSAAVVVAMLGLALSPARGRAASPGEPLTNAKIVEMTKAHLSVPVIVEQIRTRPGKYALEADDLIKLKKAGVADEAILAMQRKEQGADAASPAPTGKGTAQGAQVYLVVPAPKPAKEVPMARVRDPVPVDGLWQRHGQGSWDPLRALNEFSHSLRGLHMVRHFQVGAVKGIVGVEAWCDLERRGEVDSMHLSYVVEFPVGQPRKLSWMGWQKFGQRELSKWDREPWGELVLKVKELDPGREGYWYSLPVKDDQGRLIRTDKIFSSDRQNVGDHRLRAMDLMPVGSFVVELALDGVHERAPIEITTGDPSLRELTASCGIASGYNALDSGVKKALPASSSEPQRRAADGFVFGSSWNRLPLGSVELDGLTPRLARLMVRHGLPPQDYLPELEAIAGIARKCGELDRKVGNAPRRRHENGGEFEDLSGLGPEYAVCQQPPTGPVNVSELVHSKVRRPVWMKIVLRGDGDLWRKARHFDALVGFYPLEGDAGVERGASGEPLPDALLDGYTIGRLTVWPKGIPKEATWHGLKLPRDPDAEGWEEHNGPPLSE